MRLSTRDLSDKYRHTLLLEILEANLILIGLITLPIAIMYSFIEISSYASRTTACSFSRKLSFYMTLAYVGTELTETWDSDTLFMIEQGKYSCTQEYGP